MSTLSLRRVLPAILLVGVAAGAGYWLGSTDPHSTKEAASADATPKQRTPLYYRNPMGLPDTSPVPKKDPMGMDYVPVFADDEKSADGVTGEVVVSSEKVQMLGVRTEAVSRRVLERQIRAAARIEPDERRTYAISPKFEGYIERLHVNAVGQAVRKGQALFEAYSPELLSAQSEYAIAAEGVRALEESSAETQTGMRRLAESSLARLRNWDVSDDQIRSLAGSGAVRRTLTFRSPATGIVTEKRALQGMRFMPGDPLYQVSDLSTVWVMADLFEQDIGLVRPGAHVSVTANAYPEQTFGGTVSFIYPTVNTDTRTTPVRIELPNRSGLLKPGMYADVTLTVAGRAPVLTVPSSAILDSGTRRVVLVERSPGRFEPREVTLGARAGDRTEVLRGLRDGEPVVVAANFLIDAESNLKAALGSFGQAPHEEAQAAGTRRTSGHQAQGRLERMDSSAAVVTINHGPVDSLGWPAMSMDFKLANPAVTKDVRSGDLIAFEFVERAAGEWVVTSMKRRTASAPAQPSPEHASHDRH